MKNTLKIGLFGFGCVGQGLYDIINKDDNFLAEIALICVKDQAKKRNLPNNMFTFDKNSILNDTSINLVVELIDDAQEAFLIVSQALRNGKNVITANKKMLAENLPKLIQIQQQYGTSLLYEGSVCGSIPIIRNLEEYYNNELLFSVKGIFNGSSNYILSKIINENSSYKNALEEAQKLGFAESNPKLDVEGYDPKYKLCILALHAYGLLVSPDKVFNYGINSFNNNDLQFAKEKGFKLKLIANSQKISDDAVTLFVMPQFINKNHPLYHVENETNGVIVEAAFSQKQIFIGKGAGGHPTGAAVLSDIAAILYDYHYEYKKKHQKRIVSYEKNVFLKIYLRYEDDTDLFLFDFKEITEKYEGPDFKYLIGVVNLSDLLEKQEQIRANKLFLATIGEENVVINVKIEAKEEVFV